MTNQGQGSRKQGNPGPTPRQIELGSKAISRGSYLRGLYVKHVSWLTFKLWFDCQGSRKLYTTLRWQMSKFPEFQNKDWKSSLTDLRDAQPEWVELTLVSSSLRLWTLACLCPHPWLLFQEALKLPSSLDSWSYPSTYSRVLGCKEHRWPSLYGCWPDLSLITKSSICPLLLITATCQGFPLNLFSTWGPRPHRTTPQSTQMASCCNNTINPHKWVWTKLIKKYGTWGLKRACA